MSRPSWIGYRLSDRYLIEALLGQGGMSAVYKATDPNLKRSVAIKLIHSHISQDAGFLRRFTDEAATVARLSHPNIIQVYDFNKDQESYYMVLEMINGVTLQDELERLQASGETMNYQRVIQVISEISDAVQYAHDRGLLHRDIKPANVMLREDGRAVLMDFGIAKIMGGTNLTGTGAIIGTVQYIAPEVVEGNEPDQRVDVYAIGVMLYEMLSGEKPYDADSALAVLLKHVNQPVPNLLDVVPSAPPQLAAIVEKAMVKDPDNRYQSARELAEALRTADLTSDVPTTPIPHTEVVQVRPKEPMPRTEQLEVPKPQAPAAPATPIASPTPPVVQPPPVRVEQSQGQQAPAKKKSGIGGIIIAGIAAVAILVGVLALGAAFIFGGSGDDVGEETMQIAEAEPANGGDGNAAADEEEAMEMPAEVDEPAVVEEPTATFEPTAEPTPTVTPFPEPYVFISNISLNGSVYEVEYETFGYTEALPGMHVHFFFDTVPPEQAGSPNSGPWYVWGGPRPFNGYTTGVKPAAATQMCALVANADHSIQLNSGNCVDLPSAEVGQ